MTTEPNKLNILAVILSLIFLIFIYRLPEYIMAFVNLYR